MADDTPSAPVCTCHLTKTVTVQHCNKYRKYQTTTVVATIQDQKQYSHSNIGALNLPTMQFQFHLINSRGGMQREQSTLTALNV